MIPEKGQLALLVCEVSVPLCARGRGTWLGLPATAARNSRRQSLLVVTSPGAPSPAAAEPRFSTGRPRPHRPKSEGHGYVPPSSPAPHRTCVSILSDRFALNVQLLYCEQLGGRKRLKVIISSTYLHFAKSGQRGRKYEPTNTEYRCVDLSLRVAENAQGNVELVL